MPARLSRQGFTLIELLVVIVIIGVLLGVSGFAVNGIGMKRFRGDVNGLAYYFNHLADEALFNQSIIRWTYDEEEGDCYTHRLSSGNEWVLVPAGQNHCTFTAGTAMDVEILEPSTMATGGSPGELPALYFLPSGDYTAFRLQLQRGATYALQVNGDGVNRVTVEASSS